MSELRDPIVVKPEGFDLNKAWSWCQEETKDGFVYDDGSINWKAAFSADPGICTCPACHASYWAWGQVQRCVDCGFEYPTEWWPMYSYGVSASRSPNPYDHEKRMKHPYYRYGFENPVPDAWEAHDKIDWRSVFSVEEA